MEKIVISSTRNSRISEVLELKEKSRERRAKGLIVVEGLREIMMALSAGYSIDTLFAYENLGGFERFKAIHDLPKRVCTVSADVFAKMAYRENSDGLLALIPLHNLKLKEVRLSKKPFVIILESVEKPGNLGAILRTADAAKVDAVVICDPLTDLYNPNVIRSSIGCIFMQQVVACSSQDALQWLRIKGIKAFAAELEAAQCYHETDFTQSSAIIMGTEAEGLSDFWLQEADARIKIPMRGKIDSLNVSVSTAILTFEAMRQRGF
ncbi:MAG: RNA methyltransferase [Bacteroidales bacterium]|nr:RNA methyltransferase [Bacteroidales bacterium]MCL2132901.1 RNA methyltransferase [Bacteroidales bacterium]